MVRSLAKAGRFRRRGASARVYEAVRQAILSGQFGAGARLTEEQLASRYGVSRTPVREALFVLAAEGMVQPAKGRGYIVPHLDPEEVCDLYELQALIEGYAARRAALYRTDEELATLRELAERIDAAPTHTFRSQAEKSQWYLSQIASFHIGVAVASRNRRLPTLFKAMLETPLLLRVFYRKPAEELAPCNRYHLAIVHALERRDPEQAEALMRVHLLEARDLVLAVLGEELAEQRGAMAGAVVPKAAECRDSGELVIDIMGGLSIGSETVLDSVTEL